MKIKFGNVILLAVCTIRIDGKQCTNDNFSVRRVRTCWCMKVCSIRYESDETDEFFLYEIDSIDCNLRDLRQTKRLSV